MNGTHDTGQAGIADDGDDLDPRQAAEIIEQTAIRARRQFDPSSPIAAASTGFAASRGRWPELVLAIAIMLIAAGSTFFGPKGAWGLTGLGCAIALLAYAAVLRTWLRRPVRP